MLILHAKRSKMAFESSLFFRVQGFNPFLLTISIRSSSTRNMHIGAEKYRTSAKYQYSTMFVKARMNEIIKHT